MASQTVVSHPQDRYGRPLRDLRISVTDRCNFRCNYCMPKEIFNTDYKFLQREKLLTFEEIERVVRIFVDLGVVKLRLTGGEPLLRRHLDRLITRLADIDGIEDICLTTNGSLLTAEKAQQLVDTGLSRITVSLDGLNDAVFQQMNDVDCSVSRVLEAIECAEQVGLQPVKVNMVVKRGVNDAEILPMAEYFRGRNVILRFIEFMDVGDAKSWNMDAVLPASELLRMIDAQWPLEPVDPHYEGEVAQRWRYKDQQGEIGIVASVTQPFCGGCHRLRMTADGMLFTCLFASQGHDIKGLLRSEAEDAEIRRDLERLWRFRGDRYSELRTEETVAMPKAGMSYLGG